MDENIDLVHDIRRVQENYDSLITLSGDCLLQLHQENTFKSIITTMFQSTNNIVLQTFHNNKDNNNNRINTVEKEKIILLSQYFHSTKLNTNTYDIDVSLLKNLANPLISDIYLLNERQFQLNHFPHQEKLHQIVINKRVTFQDMFNFANINLRGQIVIIGKN